MRSFCRQNRDTPPRPRTPAIGIMLNCTQLACRLSPDFPAGRHSDFPAGRHRKEKTGFGRTAEVLWLDGNRIGHFTAKVLYVYSRSFAHDFDTLRYSESTY